MSVIVPNSAHPSLVELSNKITTYTTLIASAANTKQAAELTKLKSAAQRDLVLALVSEGHVSAATVLSSLTYVPSQAGGDAG